MGALLLGLLRRQHPCDALPGHGAGNTDTPASLPPHPIVMRRGPGPAHNPQKEGRARTIHALAHSARWQLAT